jgi:hypothetical protein
MWRTLGISLLVTLAIPVVVAQGCGLSADPPYPGTSTTNVVTGCTSAAECGAEDPPCVVRVCENGICGIAPPPSQEEIPQEAGDCKVKMCDPDQGLVEQPDDTDVPQLDEACLEGAPTCSGGEPMAQPKAQDELCDQADDRKICDGAGRCVDCATLSRCGDSKVCSSPSDCLSGSCADGVCCDSLCDQACHQCNLPGLEGQCSRLNTGTSDTCTSPQLCSVTGMCEDLDIGEACTGSGTCTTGFCCSGSAPVLKSKCGEPLMSPCSTASVCCSNKCVNNVCTN